MHKTRLSCTTNDVSQLARECSGCFRSHFTSLFQSPKDDCFDCSGYRGIEVSQRRWRLVDVLDHYSGRDWRVERHSATKHLVNNDAETIDVSTAIEIFSKTLFGRHVVRCAHDVSGLGEVACRVVT